ncbi:glycosyltransferase [Mesonia phycicola]|nr:glycosyltransferase [Mesonia phycicola]
MSRKRNYIFISTSRPGNARSDYFFRLAEEFTEKGYCVVMFVDKHSKVNLDNKYIQCITWPNRRPTSYKDFIFLSKNIINYKPNILISSFGSVNLMNITGVLFGVKNRVNYLLSVVDLFGNSSSKSELFLRKRKGVVYKLSTLLVANSLGTKKGIFGYYNIQNKNNIILPNLVEGTSINYLPYPERKKQILIMGNLIKLKGHQYLIKQFVNVLEYFPDYKLLIVGNGEEKNNLQLLVKELNLQNSVCFHERVNHLEVNKFFSEAMVHISSSLSEAFGFVNIEALREGTPIICTPTEGAVEIIDKGRNGEFFDLEEEYSLLNAIRKVFDKWDQYSLGALNSFAENFEIKKNIGKHTSLILKKCK